MSTMWWNNKNIIKQNSLMLKVLWDFLGSHQQKVSCQWKTIWNIRLKFEKKIISNFAVSIVFADGLAPWCSKTCAGRMMTKFGSCQAPSHNQVIIRHFEKVLRHFNLSINEKFFRWSDNMSDDFQEIIRHFSKSSAMSDGLMAFHEHCNLCQFYPELSHHMTSLGHNMLKVLTLSLWPV